MLQSIKREWRLLRDAEPGRRFRDRYRRTRKGGSSFGARVARMVAGLAITAAGAFMVPAPGPGWLVVALGLGLIASDIRPLATFLDRAELRVRDIGEGLSVWWSARSRSVRMMLGALGGLVAVAGSYGLLRLFVLS
ncbi:MAG: hypothetical protein KF785_14875 [Gemmatimonadales bacterium]|nr:hypothetical protein [Gemmatimonadales bacterium]